ncbi:response regulator [Pelomonas sp. UHG3]|uniref:Response regulator n=2 Tax=Roseateles hydrophilus TaxID=2975054 RepID=A0ACC6C5B7_9BURK|nr:response regulator [Pelomonas sp. UHG3]
MQARAGAGRRHAPASAHAAPPPDVVLAHLPCALAVLDSQARLLTHNAAFQQLFSLPPLAPGAPPPHLDDLVNTLHARGDFGHGEPARSCAAALRALGREAGPGRLEIPCAGARLVEVRTAPLPDGGLVMTCADLSAQAQARLAAEQASQAKTRVLAHMSHEIRTPISAVLGMLRLLQKTPLDARQRDYAVKSEGAARGLLGLLNDVLDFSKIEAGHLTLDPHPTRLDELLHDLSVILAAHVDRRDIEVLFDLDPALPPVIHADALRLQQVLVNLAGNAIKFTTAGEVVLTVRCEQRQTGHATLHFSVRDTGIGIAPEQQQRVFDGYTQAEASTARRFGGTGLGLAISRRLVQLMGGDIHLHSQPGIGSRFSFSLAFALPDDAPQPAAGTPLQALVIDDHAEARRTIGALARSLGWQVRLADSGAQALALAAQAAPDVVLLDWVMPGMDGWQATMQLRHQLGRGPLILMVTSHDRERLARRSAAEQALLDGFLVKPITAAMLSQAVDAARLARSAPGAPPEPAPQRLAGLRLLVVEDNPAGQQVSRELLTLEGAHVTLAGDGQQALTLLARSRGRPAFDAVLMDVQMPVMDGTTATRLIRRQLGLALPVIAMTASALASERQACLDAGMDEHIVKPFDPDTVVAVLRRRCGDLAPAPTSAPTAPSPPASATPALPPDLLDDAARSGIALAEALARMSGRVELFERTLAALHDQDRQLSTALATGGTVATRSLHGYRGLAAMLGAQRLAALAAEGEHAQPLSKDWHARFQACRQTDIAALDRLAARLQPPEPASIAQAGDASALTPRLAALAELLAGSDLAALDAHQALRTDLPSSARPALDAAMAALDFNTALALCHDLMTLPEPHP